MSLIFFSSAWKLRRPVGARALLTFTVLAILSARVAAAELYNSGGFEAPRFVTTQNLQGQDSPPTGQGPWVKDSGTGTALVQSTIVAGGLNAVQVTRPASSTGDTRWAVVEPFTPTSSEPGVRIDVDLRVNQATFSGIPPANSDFGPAFGIEAYDATNPSARLLIGSVTIDATTGDVLYQQANTGFLAETGTIVSRGAFHHLALTIDFITKRYTIFADGIALRTEGFVDNAAARFTDAPIAVFAATGSSAITGTGTAFFDNYVVTTIPEPGAASAVVAGLLTIVTFRRRARCASLI